MASKAKPSSRLVTARPDLEPLAGPWRTPPWTTEERLRRIEAMGEQIKGYVQFMVDVAKLNGVSVEAKDRAIVAFYERLVLVERQLNHIQEDLQLG